MFIRLRMAMGCAFVAILITSISVLAKGDFSFITITGANLKGEIRSTDPALIEGFFAFADFYYDRTSAPTHPGIGYEITRYYIDGGSEIAFDRLHYYPETGFVYYDGIVDGSSDYDGEWYTAQPEIETVFESALSARSMTQIQPSASTEGTQPRMTLPPVYLMALTTLGIALIVFFTYRLRKYFSH